MALIQLLEIAGDAVEGSYYVDHADVKAPDLTEFREQYKEAYGKDIEITAVMGHDALMLMKAAIEKAGVAEPWAIRDALETIEGVKVLTGEINMDPETHNPDGKLPLLSRLKTASLCTIRHSHPRESEISFLGGGYKNPPPYCIIPIIFPAGNQENCSDITTDH